MRRGACPASASTATAPRRSARRRSRASRAASTACSSRPTSPPAASTSRRSRTSINFDVPHVPEDYIHRVGRTARAEMTGDAFTFVSPEEQTDLAAIERAIGKRLPRITVPGFDYAEGSGRAVRGSARRAHRARSAPARPRSASARRRRPSGGAQRRRPLRPGAAGRCPPGVRPDPRGRPAAGPRGRARGAGGGRVVDRPREPAPAGHDDPRLPRPARSHDRERRRQLQRRHGRRSLGDRPRRAGLALSAAASGRRAPRRSFAYSPATSLTRSRAGPFSERRRPTPSESPT